MRANTALGRALRASIGLLASTAILAGSTPGVASEPDNNSFPTAGAFLDIEDDVEVVVTSNTSGFTNTSKTISSSTDSDWLLIVCNEGRKVTQVQIGTLTADLAFSVWTTTQSFIGTANGTGPTHETYNISAGNQDNAVVVRVYGISGATSNYILSYTCS